MRVDGSMTVRRFLAALPSAAGLLRELGMAIDDDLTLARACAEANVTVSDLERALDRVDWGEPEGGGLNRIAGSKSTTRKTPKGCGRDKN